MDNFKDINVVGDFIHNMTVANYYKNVDNELEIVFVDFSHVYHQYLLDTHDIVISDEIKQAYFLLLVEHTIHTYSEYLTISHSLDYILYVTINI